MKPNDLHPILRAHRKELFSYPNVRSVGVGRVITRGKKTKEIGIIVGVSKKKPLAMLTADMILPTELKAEGVSIDVQEVGVPKPLSAPADYDCSYYDIMRSGVDLAHYLVTGGTLGWFMPEWNDLMVTNNHVGANSNNAQIGDPIMQPSPICASTETRQVATLDNFVPVVFVGGGSPCSVARAVAAVLNGTAALFGRKTRMRALHNLDPFAQDTVNHCDLSFLKPVPGISGDEAMLNSKRVWQGDRDEADLDEPLFKSGARSGYTEFLCTQKYMTVSVQYEAGEIAMYEDQDGFAQPSAQPGDSGSGVGDQAENMRTDEIFAGSDTIGIGSPFKYVTAAYHQFYG